MSAGGLVSDFPPLTRGDCEALRGWFESVRLPRAKDDPFWATSYPPRYSGRPLVCYDYSGPEPVKLWETPDPWALLAASEVEVRRLTALVETLMQAQGSTA